MPGALPRHEHARQQVLDLPCNAVLRHASVEPLDHGAVVVLGHGVDREHAGGVADPQDLLSGEFPVDVSGQRCEEGDPADMCLFVQNGLTQMGDAPSLRNVEPEQCGKLLRRRSRARILPGAERRQQISVPVERKIAVHHGGNAQASDRPQFGPVLLPNVLREVPEAVPQAVPGPGKVVGPVPVFVGVDPVVAAGRSHFKILGNQHRLDLRRAKLDAQFRPAVQDCAPDFLFFHISALLFPVPDVRHNALQDDEEAQERRRRDVGPAGEQLAVARDKGVDGAVDQHAEERTDHVAHTAGQQRAADDGRGDGVHFQTARLLHGARHGVETVADAADGAQD